MLEMTIGSACPRCEQQNWSKVQIEYLPCGVPLGVACDCGSYYAFLVKAEIAVTKPTEFDYLDLPQD